jgi:hypothetical protein
MKVSKNLLFLKKKKQKNFWSRDSGVGHGTATRPQEQKFFSSFFQKRTFFLEALIVRGDPSFFCGAGDGWWVASSASPPRNDKNLALPPRNDENLASAPRNDD